MAAKIDALICERLVTAATAHCSSAPMVIPTPPQAAVAAAQPNLDATAASLSALSTAFTWGTILLALIAIGLALGWGYLVRNWAKEEATTVAKHIMDEWLKNEAPKILREGRDFISPDGADPEAAEVQAEADNLGNVAG